MSAREQMEEYNQCFTLFDKDGDGRISCQELGTVLRSLGQNPTEAKVAEIIRTQIAANHFDVKTLAQVMTTLLSEKRDGEEEIREAFSVFDRERAGAISAAEIRHVMTNLGEKLTDQEVDEMLGAIDVDSDGMIQYEELVRLMCSR